MGLIDRFEKTLERKVTGLFSKTFKAGLEPVEIASAIKKEMDAKASIVARDRILVPNSYTIQLSPQDFERLSGLGEPLVNELSKLATEHAKKQGFSFGELLDIKLAPLPSLVLGQLEVTSEGKTIDIQWVPTLEINGKVIDLKGPRTTVGRDTGADLVIDDSGLSRKHFEILWDGKNAVVRDLKSTNGTKIAGNKVQQAALEKGSVIEAGRTSFTFNVIARAK